MSEVAAYREFVQRYHDDPVSFCTNVLGLTPQKWQGRLLTALAKGERRISVAAGHGIGKSTVVAVAMLWMLLTRYPIKCVVTAPTQAQLYDALAAETKRWVKELPPVLQELLTVKAERIELTSSPTEAFIGFRVSRVDQPEALQGIHSDTVLLIADEASGVPDSVFEAAYGSMSGANAHVVLLSNPIRSSGYFFDSHHKSKNSWLTMRVSCLDSPLVSKDFITEMAERYGIESNQYRCRVQGLFPLADDDTVIPKALVDQAMKRVVKIPADSAEIWGVDVARMGADSSTLITRSGKLVRRIHTFEPKLDLMALSARIEKLYHDATTKPLDICIDANGLGAGCYDRCLQLGLPVTGVNVSESPSMTDTYSNLRGELWFRCRDWLAQGGSLPEHDLLAEDLIAPKYQYKANGKLGLEPKEQTAKRLKRSPDYADALIMTFASARLDPRGDLRPQSRPLYRNAGVVV